MTRLSAIILFASLQLFAESTSSEFNLKRMTVAEAKQALVNPKHDDYTSAINSILDSKMKEEEKVIALFAFFTDPIKMERMQNQLKGDASVVRSLRMCADKLKSPSEFILKLYDHRLYSADTDESRHQQNSLFLAFNSIKKPSSELLKKITSIADVKDVCGNRYYIIAKHADDETLRKALALSRGSEDRLQRHGLPCSMLESRHRPLVFTYCVDSYLKFNYPKNLFRMMVDDVYLWEKSSSYENVKVDDAPVFIKQIDRILAIKDKLSKINDDYHRLKKHEIEKLLDIRKLMILYKETTEIKNDKDIKLRHYSVYAAHASNKDLKRILARTRKMKKSYQIERIPLAMRQSRHRPLVFTYNVDSLLKFKSRKTFGIITGAMYLHESKYLSMSQYKDVVEKDAAIFIEQLNRIYKQKSSLGLTKYDVENLKRIFSIMKEKAKAYQSTLSSKSSK